MVRSWRHDAMAGGCRRALLRGRLQPRAVAAGRLAPGRAADARGRGQSGDRGRVLVGLAGAGGRPLRVRLARRRARPAPRARDQGRPRHRDGRATAVVLAAPPGEPAGRFPGPDALARQPPDLLPQLGGLPRRRCAAGRVAGQALRRAPGAGNVARAQRVRLPQRPLLLRRQRRGLPRLAPAPLRRPRRPEPGLGHRLLEPALRRLGRGRPPAAGADLREPDQAARLVALQFQRAAGVLPRGARGAGAPHALDPDHHQPDGRALQDPGLLVLGPRAGPDRQRPLPPRGGPGRPYRPGAGGRPVPLAGRRPALGADGALDQRGQLAAAQPRQAAWPDAPQQPGARGPRRRRRAVLPVAPVTRRVREVPLGDGPPRRHAHQGLARGGLARRRTAEDRRGEGQPGRRGGGAAVGLGGLVGGGAGLPPQRRPVLPGAGPRPPRRPLAPRRHRRPGAPECRPGALPAGAGAEPVPGQRRGRRQPARLRRGGRQPAGAVLQRHRRPARPGAARRLPRRLPRAAGHPGRGAVPAAGRWPRAARRRFDRLAVERAGPRRRPWGRAGGSCSPAPRSPGGWRCPRAPWPSCERTVLEMLPAQRQERILEELQRSGGVRVSDLTELLGVSDMTIRRDLDALARRGLVSKVHGGATLPRRGSTDEPGFEAKSSQERPAKEAIARRAAEFVQPGTAIAISAGTTTHAFARHLTRIPELTVVTNSLPVAEVLYAHDRPDRVVVLVGGVRTPSDALVGPVAVQTIQSLHVDCLFMGVHGIDPGAGFTSPNLVEAETNRAMVAATRRLVVLADHTKWGVVGLSTIASLDQASVLITDSGLEAEAREALTGRVGELILVEPAQIGLVKVPPLDAAGVSA